MTSQYFFRMPFAYLSNQPVNVMRENVCQSLENEAQIIDSFYNRILTVDLNRANNQYFLEEIDED